MLENSTILASVYGWDQATLSTLVEIQSLVNASARVLFGFLMDAGWRGPYRVERARSLLLTSVCMTASLALLLRGSIPDGENSAPLFFANEEMLAVMEKNKLTPWWHKYVCFALLGLGFGGNWAILPAVISSWYGKENVAIGFNVACVFFVVFANLFGNLLVAVSDSTSDENAVNLVGHIAVGCCLLSFTSGCLLVFVRPCRTPD